jgi:hypothetical protein
MTWGMRCALFAGLIIIGSAPRLGAAAQAQDRLADAWTQSTTLEAAGDVRKARAVMVEAFGALPDRYDACMRIAALSVRLHEAASAVTVYRHARQLPGAGEGAAEGLVSALTTAGYDALDRGDLGAARREWQEAIAIDPAAVDARRGLDLVGPSRGGAVEAWAGRLSAPGASAEVVYVNVPFRLNDQVSVRGAYRQVGGATAGKAGVTPFFGSQHEFYGGVTVERGIASTEVVAFGLQSTIEHIGGVAASTRIGGRYGMTFTVAGIHEAAGWNTQVMPQAFIWPVPWLVLDAGVRITRDPSVSATNATVGGALRLPALTIDAQAHLGTERLAFGMAGPSVMSFAASTTGGATVTAVVPVSKPLTLYAQVQVEQLGTKTGAAASGHYLGVAAGVRWVPKEHHP